MQLSELMQKIAQGNPPHYSVWFGEEQKILDIYLKKIIEEYKPVYCDSVSYVMQNISKKSLDKSKKVYIVTEDTFYQSQEKIWKQVEKTANNSKHIIIIRYNNIKKNTKFYKQNNCIEFPRLDESVLVNYIYKELQELDEVKAKKLCKMCGNDYGRILLEIDKVKHYIQAKKCHQNTAFDILLKQNIIVSEIGDITFELTDAVLYGDVKKSAKMLSLAKQKGEPAMMVASVLYTGFRNMLAYQGLGKDKSESVKRTGLQYWQIKQVQKNIGGYSNKELVRNMLICQKVESGIKTGTIPEDIALEYLVIKCLQ